MVSARTHWNTLKSARDIVAAAMGADISVTQQEMRVLSNSTLAAAAVLAKCLIDNGVITAQQLTDTANAVALGSDGSLWDREMSSDQVAEQHDEDE
jgi:hypothetical protein